MSRALRSCDAARATALVLCAGVSTEAGTSRRPSAGIGRVGQRRRRLGAGWVRRLSSTRHA
eukprot:13262957-Alexandrium_andersonii.AAC.1